MTRVIAALGVVIALAMLATPFPAGAGNDFTAEITVLKEVEGPVPEGTTFTCAATGMVRDVQCDSDTEFQIDADDLNDNALVEITVTNSFEAEAEPAAAEPVAAEPTFTG